MTHTFSASGPFQNRVRQYACFAIAGLAVSAMIPIPVPASWSEYVSDSDVEWAFILLVVIIVEMFSRTRPSPHLRVELTVNDEELRISRQETTKTIPSDSPGRIVKTLNGRGETVALQLRWPGHRFHLVGCDNMNLLGRLFTTNLHSMGVETRRLPVWRERWDALGILGPAICGVAAAVSCFALRISFSHALLLVYCVSVYACVFVWVVIATLRTEDPDERRQGWQVQLLMVLSLGASLACIAAVRYLGV